MVNNNNKYDELTRNVKSSAISYSARQLIFFFIVVSYNLLLTIILGPKDFGEIAIIMLVYGLSLTFSEGGLGVFLLQTDKDIKRSEIDTIFTVQFFISLILLIIIVLTGIVIEYFTTLELTGKLFLAALAIPFLLVRGTSLLELERNVKLKNIVYIELLEEVLFAITALVLALYGYGAWSISIALVVKSIFGSIASIRLTGYLPRLKTIVIDDFLKRGIIFGLHYQGTHLVNWARISINPLFIAPYLGLAASGMVDRAWYLSGAALSLIMMIHKKVLFPYISRIQNDNERIKQALEKSIYINSVLDKLLFLPLLLFTREIVVGVFGEKWAGMVLLIQILVVGNTLFGALSGPLYQTAFGLGKSRLVFVNTVIGFVSSWLLIILFVYTWGIEGVGYASILLWLIVELLRRQLSISIGEFKFYSLIIKPALAFGIALSTVRYFIEYLNLSLGLVDILVYSVISIVMYCLFLLVLDKKKIFSILKELNHR